MPDDTATFGELLRRFRLAANQSQQTLAERAGLSVDAIAALERGRRMPRPYTVSMLADALTLAVAERAALTDASFQARPASLNSSAQPAPGNAVDRLPTIELPVSPTRLVGRSNEVAATSALLQPPIAADAVRLLTLTGPGGVGKTRLALAVAAAIQPIYADGVAFVNLSTIHDPALVPLAILQHLGLPEASGVAAQQQIIAALRQRHVLLVLDNLEQVLPAGALIAALLAAAPRLQILATSRILLRLYGEHELRVPPLQMPERQRLGVANAAQAEQSEAVQLFVQRARAVRPAFELTPTTLPAVVEICIALDGLPLAIELAAARIRIFAPQALLARLKQRLALLVDGPRDVPERQRTMRGAIAWSYNLLPAAQQRMLARLGLFVGACTVDAAAAVCYVDLEGAPAPLAMLEALLEQSLLRQELGPDGEPRFSMLETIREYALEELQRDPAHNLFRRRYADYYLTLVSSANTLIMGPEQLSWLNRLEQEHDNLRAMLAFAIEHDRARLLQTVDALGRFWSAHSHIAEGRQWLETFLAQPNLEPLYLAKTYTWAALFMRRQGDYAAAAVCLETSLNLWRSLGNRAGEDMALTNYGFLALSQGNTARAAELFSASLALNRADGHQRGIAMANTGLSLVALRHDEYAAALAYAEESYALWQQIGDTLNATHALTNRGHALLGLGDYVQAATCLRQGLRQYHDLGDRNGIAECLEGLAGVLGAQQQPTRAAQLLGAAEALREVADFRRAPADYPAYERIVARACASLDSAARHQAMAVGRAIQLDLLIGEMQHLSFSSSAEA